jgi:hypothetical protein
MLVSEASANFATVAAPARLLLYPKNRVSCRLSDSEFDDGLGWNLDLLLRLRINADASLPLLLHQLAKTGQNEFAVLFDLFVREVAERIEEYSGGSFVGISGSSERDLKFTFGHVWPFFIAAQRQHCKRIAVSPSPLTVKNET